jgi:hypothetical protein
MKPPVRAPAPAKWYRQRWPWFLIAIPAAGILMATITVGVAYYTRDAEVVRVEAPPLDKLSWQSR